MWNAKDTTCSGHCLYTERWKMRLFALWKTGPLFVSTISQKFSCLHCNSKKGLFLSIPWSPSVTFCLMDISSSITGTTITCMDSFTALGSHQDRRHDHYPQSNFIPYHFRQHILCRSHLSQSSPHCPWPYRGISLTRNPQYRSDLVIRLR